jgi:hypothetical protein
MERLLYCEAKQSKISISEVVISRTTNTPDGGIDAKVTRSNSHSLASLIDETTHFQIKSGTAFKPWQEASIRKELFGSGEASKDSLGDAVRHCLDRNEVYCVVTFGHDLTPDQHSKSIKNLENLFGQCGYDSPKIKVLGQGQLCGFVNTHPALPISMLGGATSRIRSLRTWKKDSQMSPELMLADEQKKFIEKIRSHVRSDDSQYIRLVGEPGIGKTRLALEALDTDDLRNSVIYFESSSEFQSSDLFSAIISSPEDYEAIIVIDDCDERDRIDIWKSIKGLESYKLITMDHGTDAHDGHQVRSLKCPPLPEDQIKEILAAYVGDHSSLHRWAEWCSGSPRVAHAVGDNLKSNPDDVLKTPDEVDIWGRFIDGYNRNSNDNGRLLLRHIALFHKFGFEEPYSHEAKFISSLVQEAEPTITWAKFQNHIQHYRKRRIIQGDKTLFLVPKALQIYLWKDFWTSHGRGIDLGDLISRIPKSMQGWFTRNLNLAHISPVATAVATNYLENIVREGRTTDFVTSKFGAELLRNLSEAVPQATLHVLEEFISDKPDDWLSEWSDTQQNVVWALEKLAVWNETFSRTFRILVRLATTTTAKNSNNARGVVKDLFLLGEGWAPTQVSAQERVPFIFELLASSNPKEWELGLELGTKWLRLHGGMRIVGAEHQGARPDISFWRPKTYGEIFSLMTDVWRILIASFNDSARSEKGLILEKLMEVAPSILQIPSMSPEIMDGITMMCSDRLVDREKAVRATIGLMRHPSEKKSTSIKRAISNLDKIVTGTTWQSRYERWCSYSSWDEDYIFRRDKAEKDRTPEKRLTVLAKELLSAQGSMGRRIGFATRTLSHRSFHFGRILGKLDKKRLVISKLLTALRSNPAGDVNIARGYLYQLRESSPARYEKELVPLIKRKNPPSYLGALISGLPLSDDGAIAAIERFSESHFSASQLVGFRDFSLNSNVVISSILRSLIDRGDQASAREALSFVDHLIDKSPEKVEDWSLVSELLWSKSSLVDREDNMTSFHWSRVANALIEHDDTMSLELLKRIIEVDDALSPYRGAESPAGIAEKIVIKHPKEAWPILASALEESSTAFSDVFSWMTDREFNHRSREILLALDFDDILKWASESKNRLSILAHILPKTLDESPAGRLTQRALDRFGDQSTFSNGLYARFWSGSFSGPRSAHHEHQREQAREWLAMTTSTKVKAFLMDFINYLNSDIERARSEEEREY